MRISYYMNIKMKSINNELLNCNNKFIIDYKNYIIIYNLKNYKNEARASGPPISKLIWIYSQPKSKYGSNWPSELPNDYEDIF